MRLCTWPYWNSKRRFIIAISVVVLQKHDVTPEIHKCMAMHRIALGWRSTMNVNGDA